jgi:hypothetical protein
MTTKEEQAILRLRLAEEGLQYAVVQTRTATNRAAWGEVSEWAAEAQKRAKRLLEMVEAIETTDPKEANRAACRRYYARNRDRLVAYKREQRHILRENLSTLRDQRKSEAV